MGQGASRGGSRGEIKTVLDTQAGALPCVPTAVDIGRVEGLQSKWWALQKDRKVSAAVSLESYGKAYSQQFAKSCGRHKDELGKCIKKHGWDLFNMAHWYAGCGQHFECEVACSGRLIKAIDTLCVKEMDRAAAYVEKTASDALFAQVADQKLAPELQEIGRCVTRLRFSFAEVDKKTALELFESKKAPFAYGR